MNADEQDIIKRLQAWRVAPPPEHLADTIFRNAVRHTQQKPRIAALVAALEAAFTHWHYGLAYKLACLALCAALGLSLGESTLPQEDELSFVAAIAFDDEPGDDL